MAAPRGRAFGPSPDLSWTPFRQSPPRPLAGVGAFFWSPCGALRLPGGASRRRCVFYRKGFAATTVNDLLTASGTTRGISISISRQAPTLIVHGDDDQIVPISASALLSAKIIKDSTLKTYPGAPHGMSSTLKDQVNKDLLAFFKA